MTAVHVVVPGNIDDPARPSGGNVYDRRICNGLAALGWSVREHDVPGSWPHPGPADRAVLAGVIAGIGDGAVVLVDGLIASTVPDVLVPEARRLRLVILVHAPLGAEPRTGARPDHEVADARDRECAVLSVAAATITTSAFTRQQLLAQYALRPGRIHVAEPGADAADLAPGTLGGGELLCVAAVTPSKGHDVLIEALATLTDLPWRCVFAGALDLDPGFADRLRSRARAGAIHERLRFTGPLCRDHLDAAYAAADVMVLASNAETYGMVVTEALARGLPVIATAVGGLPEAVGHGDGGCRPALLVRPGDPAALAAALRRWLLDAGLRHRLRRTAGERRSTLTGWPVTADRISAVLATVAA